MYTNQCSVDMETLFVSSEIMKNLAKALWHEDIAFYEWSVTYNFPARRFTVQDLNYIY